MTALRKIMRSPITTGVLFLLAAALLLTSTIGGTRAALTYFSENYTSQVQMFDIGVSLVENGTPVSWRNYVQNSNGQWNTATGVLLENMLPSGDSEVLHVNNLEPLTLTNKEAFKIGKTYDEVLSVANSGTIDEYVRVTVYKYWVSVNADGTLGAKRTDLDPDMIDLHFVTGNGWSIDEEASTNERTVLYYDSILGGSSSEGGYASASTPFTDTLTIKGDIQSLITKTESTEVRDGKTYHVVTTTYLYDNVAFQIEAQVDAVQTHNANDAIKSAWGHN